MWRSRRARQLDRIEANQRQLGRKLEEYADAAWYDSLGDGNLIRRTFVDDKVAQDHTVTREMLGPVVD